MSGDLDTPVQNVMQNTDVIIVGGGLAGLACARRLHQCGISFQLLEAADGLGGRVRTDRVDGYLLDRGFQVYLPAYPEGKRVLDLPALQLQPFRRGALVRYQGKFRRVMDPYEGWLTAASGAFNPIGSFTDKLRVGRLKAKIQKPPLEKLLATEERTTLDELRWHGQFSPAMIDRFFRPWLGGVCLERELKTSSRFFRFVFRMFGEGGAAVPRDGMGAIPQQLAAKLPTERIRLNSAVVQLERGEAVLANGDRATARAIVVATEAPTAAKILNKTVPMNSMSHGTVTLYFAAEKPPVREAILMLNGDGAGPVNNVVVMSEAAPTYAPVGKSLIAVSVIGIPTEDDSAVEKQVRTQLQDWYGSDVASWKLLRMYRIAYALPDQSAGQLDPWQRPVRLRPGLYVCGDHRDNASIDGALSSGFRTAQAVAEDLAAKSC
jgi:phytoene dehydrogenase-like protein